MMKLSRRINKWNMNKVFRVIETSSRDYSSVISSLQVLISRLKSEKGDTVLPDEITIKELFSHREIPLSKTILNMFKSIVNS